MPASRTLIRVSAERGGSAAQDGGEDFQVQPGKPSPAALKERISRCADHIGHFQRRPHHLLGLGRVSATGEDRQRIQRAGSGAEMPL